MSRDTTDLSEGISASQRSQRARHARSAAVPASNNDLPWPVAVFLVGLVIPWIIPLGPLNLPVSRIVLILMFIPCLLRWLNDKAGQKRFGDICILAYAFWAALSLILVHGLGAAGESAGVFVIDALGAYFLARCYIRNMANFYAMLGLMAKIIVVIMPFAFIEALTNSKIILQVFSLVFPTAEPSSMGQRMGLWRTQGPFNHAIEFGVFCGSLFAMISLVVSRKIGGFRRRLLTVSIAITTMFSLSSAPIAGLIVQMGLMAWNYVLRLNPYRWKILWSLVFFAYLVIEFGSNQTPVQFYISKFTFDQQTGWYRIWIWEHGSASVLNNLWIGIGFNDWVRPKWMYSDSVDNFWLLTAMRHGLPALLFLAAACLATWLGIARRMGKDAELDTYRTAYLICMATFVFVGSTVHFWGAVYLWFIFLVGAGMWMLDSRAADEAQPVETAGASRRMRASVRVGSATSPRPERSQLQRKRTAARIPKTLFKRSRICEPNN